MSIGINVEHFVAHVHTQNGLTESLIKRLQLIARPLLMKTKLPASTWGHAIMHAARKEKKIGNFGRFFGFRWEWKKKSMEKID